MNNFDDWSQIISKYLKSEADPLASLTRHELQGDAARTAFIHAVLDRFLPESYGVGSGQIMDSKGGLSGKMDIIIYRRDFPRLDLPGSRDIFLYESVIATIEVAAKLVKKTFFNALDQCASLAQLNPDIDSKVMTGLAVRNQLTMNENRQYVHPDPIRTARFRLIARPVSFIYAFSGYKTSPNQLAETLQAWMNERRESRRPVEMKDLPAVIATQGCFAWRNSAPFIANEHSLMGVGVDQAPVRLIVLQMLHVISRRLKMTPDANGLKPGLDGYLNRMPPPEMEIFIGKARNPVVGEEAMMSRLIGSKESAPTPTQAVKPVATKAAAAKSVVKKAVVTNSPAKTATPAPKPAATPAVAKSAAVKPAVAKPQLKPASVSKPAADSSATQSIEIKARPSSSKPAVDSAAKPAVRRPAANTLSASLNPKPEAVDAPFPIPNADMIPELDPDPPGADNQGGGSKNQPASKPALNAARKKSAVDFDLSASTVAGKSSNSVDEDDSSDEFLRTIEMSVVIPEKLEKSNGSSSSAAEDFLETVKSQMVSPEPIPHLQPESEPEPEPFTSTIPQ